MFQVKTYIAPSKIHGLGVFFGEPVRQGQVIWKFEPEFDKVFEPEYVAALPKLAQEFFAHYGYTSLKSGKIILCGDNARFINHSYAPSVRELPGDGETDDVAVVDFTQGIEITSNYFTFDASATKKLGGPSAVS